MSFYCENTANPSIYHGIDDLNMTFMTFYVRLIPFWLGYSQRAHLFTTGTHLTTDSRFDSRACPGDVYGLFSWRNMKFVSVSRKCVAQNKPSTEGGSNLAAAVAASRTVTVN